MAEKIRYVAVVVIETGERVTKKALTQLLNGVLHDLRFDAADYDNITIERVRVRSVNQEDTR